MKDTRHKWSHSVWFPFIRNIQGIYLHRDRKLMRGCQELWEREDSWRVPWTSRRPNQSIRKEINSEYSLEGLMLELKLQYFGHLMQRADLLEKTLMLRKIEGRRRGQQMVGWHHQLIEHEFEQAPGDGEGQRSLVCCSPWGHKELDMIEWLNNKGKYTEFSPLIERYTGFLNV